MKIKSVEMVNFKRFTHLVIEDIPETAKLVVLLGPNGCGKSSVFDALHTKSYDCARIGIRFTPDYYWKAPGQETRPSVEFHLTSPVPASDMAKAIYVRPAHRNDPNVDVGSIAMLGSSLQERRFQHMSDNDVAVSGNYQRLVSNTLSDVFVTGEENTTFREYRDNVLGEIQAAMRRMFDDLILNSLGNPLQDKTFTFDKGVSRQFNYKNLSGGERAAFDLLLDMFVKREEYDDTVFCIDEPETHINPRIQALLLEELFHLLNEKSQLWIATHAIGMMRKAMELDKRYPGKVVFLDFGSRDFDTSQTISPTTPDRAFWERTHKIALDDLSKLVAPSRIILCEGHAGEHGFDAECYNQIFSGEFPDIKFISAGGASQLKNYHAVINSLAKGIQVTCLRDGDTLSESEIHKHRQEGLRVLAKRSIEQYLFSDEILQSLCDSIHPLNTIPDAAQQLINIKMDSSPKIKDAAAKIHQKVTDWGAEKTGSKWQVFALDMLAPLITPETETYKELREIIFGDGQ